MYDLRIGNNQKNIYSNKNEFFLFKFFSVNIDF